MHKYYVLKKPSITGFHSVHKEGCPFIHSKENRIELGRFYSCNDAVWHARSFYFNSNACIFCSKESVAVNSASILEWNMFSTS